VSAESSSIRVEGAKPLDTELGKSNRLIEGRNGSLIDAIKGRLNEAFMAFLINYAEGVSYGCEKSFHF